MEDRHLLGLSRCLDRGRVRPSRAGGVGRQFRWQQQPRAGGRGCRRAPLPAHGRRTARRAAGPGRDGFAPTARPAPGRSLLGDRRPARCAVPGAHHDMVHRRQVADPGQQPAPRRVGRRDHGQGRLRPAAECAAAGGGAMGQRHAPAVPPGGAAACERTFRRLREVAGQRGRRLVRQRAAHHLAAARRAPHAAREEARAPGAARRSRGRHAGDLLVRGRRAHRSRRAGRRHHMDARSRVIRAALPAARGR